MSQACGDDETEARAKGPAMPIVLAPPWAAAHAEACAAGEETYRDPESGYQVFTAVGLRQRGRCCGSVCRHCPFGHAAVPAALRPSKTRR